MMIMVVGGSKQNVPPEVDAALEAYLDDDEKSPKTNRPPPNVLVVDDDDAIRDTLADNLKELGFGVETAADGLDALNRLFDGPRPDLILLDIMMPRMNGIAFLRAFEMTAFSDIPVMLISAHARQERHDERYLFLKKPFDLEEMARIMNRKIEEGRSRRG